MLRVTQSSGFGVGQWTPARLNPEIWIDPSDGDTLFVERTGALATTKASIGGPVGSVRNKGSLGGWAVAPTDEARPLWLLNSGCYSISMDGSDDRLTCSLPNAVSARSSAVSFDRTNGNTTATQDDSTNVDFQHWGGAYYIGGPGGQFDTLLIGLPSSRVVAFTTCGSGPRPAVAVNRANISLNTDGRTWGTTIVSLFSEVNGTGGQIRWHQYVSVYRRVTAAEQRDMEQFVALKGGIAL